MSLDCLCGRTSEVFDAAGFPWFCSAASACSLRTFMFKHVLLQNLTGEDPFLPGFLDIAKKRHTSKTCQGCWMVMEDDACLWPPITQW